MSVASTMFAPKRSLLNSAVDDDDVVDANDVAAFDEPVDFEGVERDACRMMSDA